MTLAHWRGRVTNSADFDTVSQVRVAKKLGRTFTMSRGLPSGNTRMGMLSALAWASPPIEFSAPAWDCTATTPNRLRSLMRE